MSEMTTSTEVTIPFFFAVCICIKFLLLSYLVACSVQKLLLEQLAEQSHLIREQKETIAENQTQLVTMSNMVSCIAENQTRLVSMAQAVSSIWEHLTEKKHMEMDAAVVVDLRRSKEVMKSTRKAERKEKTSGDKRPSNPVSCLVHSTPLQMCML